MILCVKCGPRPSPMVQDAFVWLMLKSFAILLSGNIAWNKSPMLSDEHKLKLLQAIFANQNTSACKVPTAVVVRLVRVAWLDVLGVGSALPTVNVSFVSYLFYAALLPCVFGLGNASTAEPFHHCYTLSLFCRCNSNHGSHPFLFCTNHSHYLHLSL